MAKKKFQHTKATACETIARSLHEFGYPDTTGPMIEEVLTAWMDGKRGEELPHGIIGRFAERQIAEVEDARPGTFAALA